MPEVYLDHQSLCLFVEDQPATRDFLCQIIKQALPHLQIETAPDYKSAFAWLMHRSKAAPRRKLEFCFVDLGLPDGSGIELLRQIHNQEPEAKAIVVTMYDDESYLFDALSAGASGYLLKGESAEFLVNALKRLEKGEPPLSPSIARRLLGYFHSPRQEVKKTHLSAREHETLALLAKGMTVPEAAKYMGLSPQTVAGYVKIIYQKLHVSNRVEALQEALRQGLV
ncbi:MAG: response regulator transcription factor [Bdellovibrio sp.]|nr:response regulator transcription factor [Bdellovibrio sp.]